MSDTYITVEIDNEQGTQICTTQVSDDALSAVEQAILTGKVSRHSNAAAAGTPVVVIREAWDTGELISSSKHQVGVVGQQVTEQVREEVLEVL